MTIFQSIILGIVQGITEFLPISSSAHLVLVPHLLGWQIPEEQVFPFDVLVQLGTLIAVIFYFRNDLKEILIYMFRGVINKKPFEDPASRTGWFVILATIPAGLMGLMFKSKIEEAFQLPTLTAGLLIGTAILLIAAEITGKRLRDIETMTWLDALWIGTFQVFSLFPGISRSGSVITGGMTRGFKRKPAGQFAFLMAIPIMLAASLLGILDLFKISNLGSFALVMLVGLLTATIVGYFSIQWLITYISQHSLMPFAGYCLLLGIGSLLFSSANFSSNPTIYSYQEKKLINIGIDSELTWLLPIMNGCSQKFSDFEWILSETSNDHIFSTDQDLSIHLEEPSENGFSHFLIGSVTVYPVTNTENQLESIDISLLQNIFSSQIATWQDLYAACSECFQNGKISSNLTSASINLWIEPPESKLNQKVLESLDNGNNQPTLAYYAPHIQALSQSITNDPAAIGFMPAPAINDKIKKISLSKDQQGVIEISLPIFASSQDVSDQHIKDWLYCIQEELKLY